MKPQDVITQLQLREVKGQDGTLSAKPEAVPSNLLGVFRDRYQVQQFTDDKNQTWLLFDNEYMVLQHKL